MSDYGEVIGPLAVRFERVLPGPIERVWRYLTESDLRETWFAAGPMEAKVGGAMTFYFQHQNLTDRGEQVPEKYKAMAEGPIESTGTITVWDPPRHLAFVWHPNSEVSFELSPKGKDVLLRLTHRKLASRDEMVDVCGGWHAHLGVLSERLAGQRPAPFWPRIAEAEREYEARIPK
jgi:uncharacterized protein YndB with AHSA1/START domain